MQIFIVGVTPENWKSVKDKPKPDNVIYIPDIFVESFNDQRPYQIWRGSRFSAKSWTKNIQYLTNASTQPYFRGIFARHTQKAARDSTYQLFKDICKLHPYLGQQFYFSNPTMKITHIESGNFIQGGSFEDPSSLMSVPELTDFWAEEPISRNGSISRSAFEDIAGTLRNSVGLVPKFHFTFNPISKDNFIYEDFFHPEKAKYDVSRVNDVVANWYHSPFCPEDRKEFLNEMKRTNPTRYEVDGCGNWGEPSNDQPYISAYQDEIVYAGGKYSFEFEQLDTWLSFDFNHSPCTATCYQVVPGFGIKAVREYSKNGGTRKLCEVIKEDFGFMSVNRLLLNITGDSNGKNSTSTGGDVTDYDIIKEQFKIMDTQTIGVHSRNKSLEYSRRLVNEFLTHVPFFMDKSMELLRSDIMKAREDKNGNLYKNRKEGFGMDMLDNFRYFVHAICPNGYDDIQYWKNKLT